MVTGVVSRRAVRPLGDEDQRPLPGDELLPDARIRWTHGITIHALPTEIWPWLVQMGCRRAGWYSYDGLDNGGVPSADRIVPELQRVETGDLFPWTPKATDGFTVRAAEPGRALILGGDDVPVIWTLALVPGGDTTTRLLSRGSGNYESFAVGLLLRLVWRPIHFGMQRRQLLNLKQLVEAAPRAS